MERQENKYKYGQLEQYKEVLEIGHIKRKMLVVNIIIILLSGVLLYFAIGQNIDGSLVYPSLLILGIIIIINTGFHQLKKDLYSNLKLAMYTTVIGLYVTANLLVFNFLTPSVFTVLFLTYAVVAIYQDIKAMILSSSLLFISGFLLVSRHPQIFSTTQNGNPQIEYVQSFLLIFVLLLTLSSYILIKRKTFFYNQLASIRESELRNIELMEEVALVKTKTKKDLSAYYNSIEDFNKALSKKIGVPDLLGRKVKILKDLRTQTVLELSQKYKDYTLDELKELEVLQFDVHKKMQQLSIKASKSLDINVTKKEIFSESQFKSFKHIGDSKYTQIISFVVFYTLLKIDKPYLKKLDETLIKDMLYNSEFYYRVDQDVIDVYLNNSEVFDTIVNDYLKGGW